jgi:hypothetical protein
MDLFYDPRDDPVLERRGSRMLYWLDDLGARPLDESAPDGEGFLFAGARPLDDYRRLVSGRPNLRDRPEERAPLLRLDTVLEALRRVRVDVPTPRTWSLRVDEDLPHDLTFPLFVRTAESSWKLGGKVARVNNPAELGDEASALRRAFGWDALVLAREWLDLAPAGVGMYGPIPQEVRVWVVDGVPFAWAFHYLNVLKAPAGFPPPRGDLAVLARHAARVGSAFRSRLVAADFARRRSGGWCFIEAGPGSCADTAHEAVFKAVARRLMGKGVSLVAGSVGGPLPPGT